MYSRRRAMRVTAICVLALAAIGCGGGGVSEDDDAGAEAGALDAADDVDGATGDAGTSDAGEEGGTPADAELVAVVASHVLDDVLVGASGMVDVVFANTGEVASGPITTTLEGDAAYTIGIDGCEGVELEGGAECTVQVLVDATSEGSRDATVRVSADEGQEAATTLSVAIVRPFALELDDASHDFGTVIIGVASNKVVRVTNTGGQTSPVIGTISAGHAAYAVTSDACSGATLAPGAHCEFTVVYEPTIAGDSSMQATITAGSTTLTFDATGEALAPASIRIDAASPSFADTQLGDVSSPVAYTVHNDGDVATGVLMVSITGSDASAFVVDADACAGGILDPGTECTIALRFAPTGARGHRAASLVVVADPGGAGMEALSADALAPASLDASGVSHAFGIEEVGGDSAEHPLTITNVGDITTGALSLAITGTDVTEFALRAGNCTGALDGEESCELFVSFAPTRYGAASATVTVTSASGASYAFDVTGTGRDHLWLTVETPIPGFGAGTVTGAGLACPSGPCSVAVPRTTGNPTVTITATPAPSSTFVGWGGACDAFGTANACTITLSETATLVNVAFDLKAYEVTIDLTSIEGRTGIVRSTGVAPYGIDLDCGATCTVSVTHGTAITLIAEPTVGAYFGGFEGGCTGTGRTCPMTVTSDTTITATFTPANRTFTTATAYTLAEVKAFATDASTEATKMRSGADAICQSLGGAPTFRAYLASVSENAITRLPNGARGFVRADGRPFKTRLEPTSPTFYPPNLDQTGAVVSGVVSSTLWTGADRFGAGSSQRSCGDWTSGQVNLGLLDSGATGWTTFAQNTCSSTARHHLLCLETAYRADVAPSAPPANARLVFVTRGTFDPASGVDGADALCESEAATHLPGTYRAILATTTSSQASRFTARPDPIYRPDGTYLSANLGAFFTNGAFPLATVSTDAQNGEVESLVALGAGDANALSMTTTSCWSDPGGSWSTTNANAHLGASMNRTQWMTAAFFPCTWPVHVRCMQE